MCTPAYLLLCEVRAAVDWMKCRRVCVCVCVCVCVWDDPSEKEKKTFNLRIIYCEADSSEPKGPAECIFCRNKDKIIYSPIILISLPEHHFL
jgi:hypothetical protein